LFRSDQRRPDEDRDEAQGIDDEARTCAPGGDHHPAQTGPDNAGRVEDRRIQAHRALDVLAADELADKGLAGG
jgi:hypothetical protein